MEEEKKENSNLGISDRQGRTSSCPRWSIDRQGEASDPMCDPVDRRLINQSIGLKEREREKGEGRKPGRQTRNTLVDQRGDRCWRTKWTCGDARRPGPKKISFQSRSDFSHFGRTNSTDSHGYYNKTRRKKKRINRIETTFSKNKNTNETRQRNPTRKKGKKEKKNWKTLPSQTMDRNRRENNSLLNNKM